MPNVRERIRKVLKEYRLQYSDGHTSDYKIIDGKVVYFTVEENLTDAIIEIFKGVVGEEKNNLPLELQYCGMEVHRKEQNLSPLFNEIRNGVIDKILSRLGE